MRKTYTKPALRLCMVSLNPIIAASGDDLSNGIDVTKTTEGDDDTWYETKSYNLSNDIWNNE